MHPLEVSNRKRKVNNNFFIIHTNAGKKPKNGNRKSCDHDENDGHGDNDDDDNKKHFGIDDLPVNFDFIHPPKEQIYREGNHIYFRADITFETIGQLGKLIDGVNKEYKLIKSQLATCEVAPKPIYLHITSKGGIIFGGFMGHDMIKNSEMPITTVVDGAAVSAGTLLSIAGQNRLMTKNSYMLIHQLSSESGGNFEQLVDSHENHTNFMDHIKQMYMKNSNGKLTMKKLNNVLKRDIFWDYDKCFKFGLVDGLYDLNTKYV